MESVDQQHFEFLPGINSFPRKEECYPVIHPADQGILQYGDATTPYYLARAEKPRALIVGVSGLNSHFLLSKKEIRLLNERGFSVIWMANPLPANDTDPFIDSNTDLARAFLTHPRSPVNMLFDRDLPRYIFTHSTGSQIYLSLMHERDTNRKLAKDFQGAAHIAPFFDSANASIAYPALKQRMWELYCTINRTKRSNETILGRAYLKYFASHESFAKDAMDLDKNNGSTLDPLYVRLAGLSRLYGHAMPDLSSFVEQTKPVANIDPDGMDDEPSITPKDHAGPTYGHILEVQFRGRQLMAQFNAAAVNVMPQIFVIGGMDKFACPATAISVARQAGIEMLVVKDAGHDPIKNNKAPRDYLIARVEKCVEAHEKLRADAAAFQNVKKPEPEKLPVPVEHLSLSDRARLALEGGARLLNAGTGFAQGLLAGGVRNPEVR